MLEEEMCHLGLLTPSTWTLTCSPSCGGIAHHFATPDAGIWTLDLEQDFEQTLNPTSP